MLPTPGSPASRGFTQTLGDQLHVTPGRGVLGNLADNLTGTVATMRDRDQHRMAAYKMQRAIADFNGQPQPVDFEAIPRTAHPWLYAGVDKLAAALDDWRCVPDLVVAEYRRLRPMADKMAAAVVGATGPADRIWWHPEANLIWVESPNVKEAGYRNGVEVRPEPPTVDDGRWLVVKQSVYAPVAGFRSLIEGGERLLGGPTPLTNAIVGGVVGGGLGYGAGAIAESLAPEGWVEEGKLRRNLGLAGAGLGAAPGLWMGSGNMRSQDPNLGGVQGLFKPHPFQKRSAFGEDSGAAGLRSIPVDAFNRAVWNDVRNPGNAFGTRSPWGDNDQPLGTPPWVAAAATGLVAGTGAMTDQRSVTPWQVGIAAAKSGGKGLAAGYAVGKLFGVLDGLKTEKQQGLQQAGLWSGLLTGAVRGVFGG